MKVLLIIGTRPEAIKMCPLVMELKKHRDFNVKVCVTGQHREMLDQVLSVFRVEPDYDLNIMKEHQTLFDITSEVLLGMDKVLRKEAPDIVLVHGDTTTSFAAALAGFYAQVKVGHVEAGLRTYNLESPYPEEMNRQVVDQLSTLFFAPTETAKKNLIKEGKKESLIYVTGNTVIDALQTTINHDFTDDNINWAKDSRMVLMTAHRRENLGETMKGIFSAVRRVVENHPEVKLIYPVHKNPAVRKTAYAILSDHERIRLIEPLDVIAFHNYMARSYLILTDSGGIQEEAPSLGVPVLVMRDETERPEGVEAGTVQVTGTKENAVYEATQKLLTNKALYEKMSKAANPYGDGHASEKIATILKSYRVMQ